MALIEIRPCLQPLMPSDNKRKNMIEDRFCNSWEEFQEACDGWSRQMMVIQNNSVYLGHMNTNRSFIENLDNILSALKGKVNTSCDPVCWKINRLLLLL